MRRRVLNIYQNFPNFAPYWAPNETRLFILNPHPPGMFPTNLVEIGLLVLEKKIF